MEYSDSNENMETQRRHRKPEQQRDQFFLIRQILNVLFVLVGIVGCYFYVKIDDRQGAILFIIAMAFKMAECALRFRKK